MLIQLEKKNGHFFFGNQKLEPAKWAFASHCCDIVAGWAFVIDGEIRNTYYSVGQCCTGLIVHKRVDGVTMIVQLPIIATEAVSTANGTMHFMGAACKGEGTVAYNADQQSYEWVVRKR